MLQPLMLQSLEEHCQLDIVQIYMAVISTQKLSFHICYNPDEQ